MNPVQLIRKYLFNWFAAAVFVLLAGTLLVVENFTDTGDGRDEVQRIRVVSDSFSVSITERGLVRPARISPVKSKISSNQAQIIWLVKEGSSIQEGEVVAKFDTKPFLDELSRTEQETGDARAALVAARKLLLMQQEEEQGKIEEAERKAEIAAIEAENIRNGSGPLERKQVEQRVSKARRGYSLAQANLDDMEVLLKKGHASIRERDKALDEYESASEQLNVAEEELRNFDDYKWPKMIRQAELLVNGAESELQRVKVTAELQVQNRMAQVEKMRRNLANRKAVRDQARLNLENCDVKAPTGGILLYSELPLGNSRRKIQIGDSVWVGQTFMEVPDTSELVVEVQVREIDVAKISEGMEATIELDAFPERTFPGRVERVASLAEEGNGEGGVRRFYARIGITDKTEQVHVGMSATVDIKYHTVAEALLIPAGAIIFKDGKTMVSRVTPDGQELAEITLGARGLERVEVVDGLAEGEFVTIGGLRK